MNEKRKELLMAAFTGEARAFFRLQAFAERAEEEGYPQIAALFRAISEAEAVHARNHSRLIEAIGTTEENLRYAFEQESFVNEVAYPELLKAAWAAEDEAAVRHLTWARNAEERHARLYKHALGHMVADRTTTYYVCGHCGWVEDAVLPEACPNCTNPAEDFKAVR